MDFGYKPPIPLAAVLQGSLDRDAIYGEMLRRKMEADKFKLEQEQAQSQMEDSKYSNAYQQALTDLIYNNMGTKEDKLAKIKAESEAIKAQQAYPIIQGISAQAQRALQTGNMDELYQVADMYERVKDRLPESFKTGGSPTKYSVKDKTGAEQRSILSNFDPQMFIDMAGGADRSKAVAGLQTQDAKNQGGLAKQGLANEGALGVAQIQAAAKRYAADAMMQAKRLAASSPKPINANQAAAALLQQQHAAGQIDDQTYLASLQEVIAASALAAPGQQNITLDPSTGKLTTPAQMRQGAAKPAPKLPEGWGLQ